MKTGLIHIYCGDGKGKTTAAVGLAIRCAGGGGRVLFFQFMKGDSSSERNILGAIANITLLEGYPDIKFMKSMNEQEKKDAEHYYTNKLEEIINIVSVNKYQMLVMDEIIAAMNGSLLNEEKVINFLKNKPATLEVVMTGRNPSEKLKVLADYISETKKIKHPFDKGIYARKLIEF